MIFWGGESDDNRFGVKLPAFAKRGLQTISRNKNPGGVSSPKPGVRRQVGEPWVTTRASDGTLKEFHSHK
jgi:hypothetical protein